MSQPIEEILSLRTFKRVISSPGVVVLDFYSPFCAPCVVVLPLYHHLAEKYPNASFYKINGYESQGQEMQRLIGVVWWPTFIVYKDGIEQWRAKIPNPPQKNPTAELESILISVMS